MAPRAGLLVQDRQDFGKKLIHSSRNDRRSERHRPRPTDEPEAPDEPEIETGSPRRSAVLTYLIAALAEVRAERWRCMKYDLVACLVASGFVVGWLGSILAQGFLDALGAGGSEALVDGQSQPEVRGGFGRVAILQVAAADSLQGTRFLQGGADLAGDGQRLAVMVAGLSGGRSPGRELAEAVEHAGLAVGFAAVAHQLQRLLVAGGGGRVVAGQLLD